MLAAIAALLFLIALILQLTGISYAQVLLTAGLLCMALSMCGLGGPAPKFSPPSRCQSGGSSRPTFARRG